MSVNGDLVNCGPEIHFPEVMGTFVDVKLA